MTSCRSIPAQMLAFMVGSSASAAATRNSIWVKSALTSGVAGLGAQAGPGVPGAGDLLQRGVGDGHPPGLSAQGVDHRVQPVSGVA